MLTMSLSSCMDKSDFFKESDNKKEIDSSFDFNTRKTQSLQITAINELGKNTSGALFSIYTENPEIGDDGSRTGDILPIYQGYTNNAGIINANIKISTGTNQLFIYPEYSGYGFMQSIKICDGAVQSITFDGSKVFKGITSRSRGINENDLTVPRSGDWINRGSNYKFYSYLTGKEIDEATGVLNPGNGVVSLEELDESFKKTVNNLFPEKETYQASDIKKTTDLLVKEENGIELWVTYIGDGGFVSGNNNKNIHNGLYYYTYTEDNKPYKLYTATSESEGYLKSDEYHLTAALPNVHPSYIRVGTKVQLLYFNKDTQQYDKIFPKGTYIGLCLNHNGYKPNNGGYSMSTSANNTGIYFTSVAFNSDGQTHGIIHWSEVYKCYIVGMERKGGSGDNDFNDILVKLTLTPAKRQNQEETINIPDDEDIADNYTGIYAFEDQWPKASDYDLNDFVTKYKYGFEKNTVNKIIGLKMTFMPQAVGAWSSNGFGIQLPISKYNILETVGCTLEDGITDDNATFIIYNDVRSAFGGKSGFINTIAGTSFAESSFKELYIQFKEPLNSLDIDDFNPFLFSGKRGHEIHLANKKPTSKADQSLFGTEDDKTDFSNNISYRMDNHFPWALDISYSKWVWPTESSNITTAYGQYESWYENWKNGEVENWWNYEQNQDNIYQK